MAEKVPDTSLRWPFVGLAKVEAEYKLLFETEFEGRVLMHDQTAFQSTLLPTSSDKREDRIDFFNHSRLLATAYRQPKDKSK